MAMPIKETPVLTGKDASAFIREVRMNEAKASEQTEASRRAKSLYAKVQQVRGFCL